MTSLCFSTPLEFELQYRIPSHANHQEDNGQDQLGEDTDPESLGDEGEEKSWNNFSLIIQYQTVSQSVQVRYDGQKFYAINSMIRFVHGILPYSIRT